MNCPKIEAIHPKTVEPLGYFCNIWGLGWQRKEWMAMTLPFENDTRIIVKKLAKRNLKADKSRNILIIITIALGFYTMA